MKGNNITKLLGLIAFLVLIVLSVILFWPNVKPFKDTKYFYVRTGWTMADVDRELVKQRIIKRTGMYQTAKKILAFNSDEDVHPGKYKIGTYTSNFSIINRIKNNKEVPVVLSFKEVRTPPEFVDLFYTNVQSTEESIYAYLFDSQRLKEYNCDSTSLLGVFFREEIETRWSEDFQNLISQMHQRYLEFWKDKNRQAKLAKLNLSQMDAMILTSIVQGEIRHDAEAGTVARVYLNRLDIGMKLQADPTVLFAKRDYKDMRVSENDSRIKSPFNTYYVKGLPPGPIQTIRPEIVDSVLNSKPNEYLFFCADPENIGYHKFATNYEDHLQNAKKYHDYLDQKNIH